MSEPIPTPTGTTVINLTINGDLQFSFDSLTIINNFSPTARDSKPIPSNNPQETNSVPPEVQKGPEGHDHDDLSQKSDSQCDWLFGGA